MNVAPTTEEPITCDRYYTENNKTHFIYGGYEGIPENLMINVLVWAVLLILFSFLRKIAWDYGRIALVSRTEARGFISDDAADYNVWTSLFYGDHTSLNELRASQESLDAQLHRQDKGFCNWIVNFFKIKDDHILQKSGPDAVQYLQFQRYLLVYMSVVTVFCIGVILPVNFQGDLEGDTQTFGHTTISNIKSNSPTLWVHSVLAVVLLVIVIIFMRHFSVKLKFEEDEHATRTLMISNIPRDHCQRPLIMQHFQEAYPESPVQDLQFAYNISKLIRLDRRRQRASEGRINSVAIHKQCGDRPMMIPYPCGQCCQCCKCCGCKEVDAIDFYTAKEERFKEKCEAQKLRAFREALGICFVTFEDDHVASRIHTDFRVSCKGAHNPVASAVSRQLNVINWEVRYSPTPDNIFWENLSISPAVWWMRALCMNLLLFLLFFFLTTPSMFLNLLNAWGYQRAFQELHNPLLVQFVPTLLLWVISSILPNLVYYTDYYCIGHWTRTAEHHAVMRKTFVFLLLMVLVLPSLGLTSAKALIEWFASKNEEQYRFRAECIFIPDNGAFFVNYVITSAFIGTAAELVRLPELLLYAIKLMLARSAAERTSVRKSVVWEFQFGCQYAWMLCVFAVVMVYCIPCPLIAPFGLVYLLMKHLVDRYNIFFAYGPSKIDANIHASAVNFVMVSVILLQASVLFFTFLRAENLQGITIFSIVVLFLTLIMFFGRICFGWFKGFSPIRYKVSLDSDSDVVYVNQPDLKFPANKDAVGKNQPFIPSVLLEDQVGDVPLADVTANVTSVAQTYGATDCPPVSMQADQAMPGSDTHGP